MEGLESFGNRWFFFYCIGNFSGITDIIKNAPLRMRSSQRRSLPYRHRSHEKGLQANPCSVALTEAERRRTAGVDRRNVYGTDKCYKSYLLL